MKNSNSESISNQSVGIDVACQSLEARIGTRDSINGYMFGRTRSFSNSQKGFDKLLGWVRSHTGDCDVWFIMEATGSYYERLAWFLCQQSCQVCVLVPHRANHYAKSLPQASKTDVIDARKLARYGLERTPTAWEPADIQLREIKQLLRERQALKKDLTRVTNRMHAADQAYRHPESSLPRWQAQQELLQEHIDQIEAELWNQLQQTPELYQPVTRIAKVKGLGWLTVLIVVAETNGFALITNRQQLASFSGLDVVLDESGDRKGATKISKQGSGYIRGALYMPVLSVIQHNRALKAFYQRIAGRNQGNEQVAVVAVMRKVVLLIYSLWKTGQSYDPEFHYQQITNNA
jgi:transposase